MILLVHMLFGASIGLIFQNTPLAFFLAFLSHYLLVYICALFTILPDKLKLIHSLSQKILNWHHKIHAETIHYLTKQKNFPVFWKIFTQVITVIISIILLQKS